LGQSIHDPSAGGRESGRFKRDEGSGELTENMQIGIRSFLRATGAGIVAGFIFLIFFPFAVAELNKYLNLPRYDHVLLMSIGAILVGSGILMFMYCSGLFNKWGKGTPAPIEPPKKLVAQGIYKYTRNPMYLGYFAIVLGEFLLFGYILLAAYFFFIVIFINVYLRVYEEPGLKERFGYEYKEYKRQVPRWFHFKIGRG
jgi:protein-S-isoprenylcysteine O-methyltransferase Ste14